MDKTIIEELKKLHHICFPSDSEIYIANFFDKKIKRDQFSYITDDKKIVAVAYYRLFEFKFYHSTIILPFITGVGTLPEYRNKGYSKQLLTQLLDSIVIKKFPLVALHPFNHEFYRKFGFETMVYMDTIAYENLQPAEEIYTIKKAEMNTVHLLTECFTKFTKDAECCHIRDDEYFKEYLELMFDDGGNVDIIFNNDAVVGYSSYCASEIEEVAVLDKAMLKTVCENATADSVAIVDLTTKNQPYTMAKIMNVVALLKMVEYINDVSQTFCFNYFDDIFPQSNCLISLTVKNGKCFEAIHLPINSPTSFNVNEKEMVSLIFGKKDYVKNDKLSDFKKIFKSFNTIIINKY